jgi:hypothetical protein
MTKPANAVHVDLYVKTVSLLYVPLESNISAFEPQSVLNVLHMILGRRRDYFPEQH